MVYLDGYWNQLFPDLGQDEGENESCISFLVPWNGTPNPLNHHHHHHHHHHHLLMIFFIPNFPTASRDDERLIPSPTKFQFLFPHRHVMDYKHGNYYRIMRIEEPFLFLNPVEEKV